MPPKRQRRTLGALLKVPLGDGFHVYAQTLQEADFALFDMRTDTEACSEEIVCRPVLFVVAVHKSAWTNGRWRKVAKAPVSPELMIPRPMFIQDTLRPDRFQIYVAGEIRPATRAECVGLERCAVWDPEHVEDRLRDHFAGRPNKWVESMRLH